MTIKRYAGDKLVGLSSDTKPTNLPDGATFYETDTLASYLLVGGSWSPATISGIKSGAQTAITVSTTEPSSPSIGDLWVDTN